MLENPHRELICSAEMYKVASTGRCQLYRFYLFNDVLLYGKVAQNTLKTPRVLHLSLCTVATLDMDGKSHPITITISIHLVSHSVPLMPLQR